MQRRTVYRDTHRLCKPQHSTLTAIPQNHSTRTSASTCLPVCTTRHLPCHVLLGPNCSQVTAQEANAAALARCKEVMEVHRQQFAALPLPAMGSATANAWQAEAARRWGPRVLHVANVHDWAAYVRSRTASPPPLLPSPYALLQERYAFDPWHLLVACVLMSRVSSAEVKERCLGGFFAACPTPSALLDTDPATLLPILRSLGLFPNRMSAIVDVTQRSVGERYIERESELC